MMFLNHVQLEECWELLHGQLGPGYVEFFKTMKCIYCSCVGMCDSKSFFNRSDVASIKFMICVF